MNETSFSKQTLDRAFFEQLVRRTIFANVTDLPDKVTGNDQGALIAVEWCTIDF